MAGALGRFRGLGPPGSAGSQPGADLLASQVAAGFLIGRPGRQGFLP